MQIEIANAILKGIESNTKVNQSGCGRAYVCLSDKSLLKHFKAGVELAGKKFLKKAYGTGDNALYVGYDNATGLEISKAIAISDNLNAIGVKTYWDAVAD